MENLIFKILNMTITGSVVILFVLAARLLLRKAPKIFSYCLWAAVLFRLLCPVSFTMDFSLLGLLNTPAVERSTYTTAAEYISYGEADRKIQMSDFSGSGNIGADIPAQTPVMAEDHSKEGKVFICFVIWLIGLSVMAVYSLISCLLLRQRLIGAVRLRGNMYLADGIDSPFVLGILRPRIYLPSNLAKQEQKYIILHEQHHIRRKDHIIKVLAFAALCIHWFNPLVWAAFVLSSKDMEMSCDEAVVKALGAGIRREYSASLLSLSTGKRIIAGTPLAFGEGNTKSRIKNILKWKRPKLWITAAAAVVCAAAVTACVGNPSAKTVSPESPADTLEDASADRSEDGTEETAAGTLADGMELCGSWILDTAYTERADSSLSLRGLFGTALGDYGASLQISADGSIEYAIGVLNGKGTWQEDGDTGRYIAELTVYPDEREETLTFGAFRENPEESLCLALDYEGYCLYWTRVLDEADLDAVISACILAHDTETVSEGSFRTESHVILANETMASADSNEKEEITVFLMVLRETYQMYEGTLENISEEYRPAALTLLANPDGTYSEKEYWKPREGSYYVQDIREKFPGEAAEDALNGNAYLPELKDESYEKAKSFFYQRGDLKAQIEERLIEICEGSVSSAPADAIRAHEQIYEELLGYETYTLQYCYEQFLKGDQTDLKGKIMEHLCVDIMGSWGFGHHEVLYETGQDWFDAFAESTRMLAENGSMEEMEKNYPASWILFQMMDKGISG